MTADRCDIIRDSYGKQGTTTRESLIPNRGKACKMFQLIETFDITVLKHSSQCCDCSHFSRTEFTVIIRIPVGQTKSLYCLVSKNQGNIIHFHADIIETEIDIIFLVLIQIERNGLTAVLIRRDSSLVGVLFPISIQNRISKHIVMEISARCNVGLCEDPH